MDVNIIMEMVKPYVKNDSITYHEFENLFSFVSLKEQYQITNILFANNISLEDDYDLILDDDVIEVEEDSTENFEILYNDSIFTDKGESVSDDRVVVSNHEVKQINEILCRLIQEGNKQACQDLCVKNKGLVDKFAGIYERNFGNRLDFKDLEQAGFIGLIKAAERYNCDKDTLFSTYAVFWIKQAITREIYDKGFAIRVPVHMMEKVKKVTKLDNQYSESEPSYHKRLKLIANEMDITEQSVEQSLIIRTNFLGYSSLNVPIGEDKELELGSMIPDEANPQVEDEVFSDFLHEELYKAFAGLSDREKKVLVLRFGLEDGKDRTLEEVGQVFGVTRERIRQIEAKAFRKLRDPVRARKLKDFL